MTCTLSGTNSHERARVRFSTPLVAEGYPNSYRDGRRRDRLEKKAILSILPDIGKSAEVLDFPCGTGRLTRLLMEQGYTRIHGADISPAMIGEAQKNCENSGCGGTLSFAVADIMQTGYAPRAFELILCNRLFHHFNEKETRLKAMKELNRICGGYLVVSFFNRFSLTAQFKHFRRALKGEKAVDRIPIAMSRFESELRQSGFEVCRKRAVSWGVSPLWYILAKPAA